MSRRELDLFYDDADWKPEPEADPELSQEQSRALQSLLAPGVSRGVYRGACTIVEFQSNPLTVAVIRDVDKFLMRFPFGGVVPDDPDPPNGSRRETKEEVGLKIGKLTPKNFIGEFSGGPNCNLYAFAKRLPAEARDKVVLGPEQKDWAAMLFETLDRYVDLGYVSKNHANIWQFFRKWRLTEAGLYY